MTIQGKFILSISVLVVGIMAGLVLVTIQKANTSVLRHVSATADQLSVSVVQLLTVTDQLMQQRVVSTMKLLQQQISALGEITQGDLVLVTGTSAPDLIIGSERQANNFRLLDEVTKITGGTATLFSRYNDDFVRVSTNVIVDGNRAVGTLLNPNGRVIANIRQRLPFYGQVDILGTPYITGYEPLTDQNQNVVGIAYVGFKADLSELEQSIKKSQLLKEGFVAVLDDQQRVRLHSATQSQEHIQAILEKPTGWHLKRQPFAAWGYEIVVGYSEQDFSELVLDEALRTASAVIVVGVLIIGALLILLRKLISVPLQYTTNRLVDLTQGDGDLTRRFESTAKDELGLMAREFDKLLEQIRQTILKFSSLSQAIAHASDKLAAVSKSTRDTSTDQQQQLEQIATAAHEMTATATSIARDALEAEQAAKTVVELTNYASETLDLLVSNIRQQAKKANDSEKALVELNKSSASITSVLSVINALAEQTNLLALNAAIEAARAGEQGRGFAVVAAEVRNLAAKTQSSTNEIQQIIAVLSASVKEVSTQFDEQKNLSDQSVKNTENAVHSLQKLIASVTRINEVNASIASAAEEQSIVTENVSANLEAVKMGADTNTLEAKQMQDMAKELSEFVKDAKLLLSKYKF